MQRFAYRAYTVEGRKVSGEVRAATSALALDLIAGRNLTPVSISQRSTEPWWAREFSLSGGERKVRPAELERFFSVFASLLRAKLPLARVVAFCAQQAGDRRFGTALADARSALENGQTLAAALSGTKGMIPDRYLALLGAGERANRLEATASAAASQLLTEDRLAREFRGALVYPAILMAMSVAVLSILVFYLAPTLVPVFESGGRTPPVSLRAMSQANAFLREYWIGVIAVVAAVSVLGMAAGRSLLVRATTAAIRVPVVGRYIRQRETLRLLQAMLMMLAGGGHLTTALASASEASVLPAYRDILERTRTHIEAGGSLSDTFANEPLLDEVARVMVAAGEESDRLVETIAAAVEALGDATAHTLSQSLRLLTPILTLLIGSFVAAVILSTMSAIMDLNDIAI